eukprot:464189_1
MRVSTSIGTDISEQSANIQMGSSVDVRSSSSTDFKFRVPISMSANTTQIISGLLAAPIGHNTSTLNRTNNPKTIQSAENKFSTPSPRPHTIHQFQRPLARPLRTSQTAADAANNATADAINNAAANAIPNSDSPDFTSPATVVYDATRALPAGSPHTVPTSPMPACVQLVDALSSRLEWEKFCVEWSKQKNFAWSVWTWNDDLQTMKASAESAFINPEQIESLTREKIGGFAISFSSAVSYTIELRHRHRTVQLPISDTIVWAKLEQMFTDESSVKFAFQTKTLLEILWKIGLDLKGHISDPRVAHWLMNSDDKKSPTMSELHLRYVVDPKHENAHLHAHYSQSQVPVGQQSADARVHGAHVWQCWRTMRQLVQLLERRGMLRTFKEVEMPLLRVLACMEWAGLGFRRAPCVRYAREAQTKITYLEMRANVLAGRDIDLNSPKDCGHVLFNDLGLHVPKSAHINARGDPNCNKAVLDQMLDAHPLVAIIKEHRLLCHYMRFYMKPLPEKARWDARFSMHRIHATFLQVSTSTGRVTMSFPNLQNVSKCIQFQPLRRLNIQQEIEAGADFSSLLLRRPTEDCVVVAVSTREPG